ncbi:hypothetical protein MMPV_008788 [Pyropia vietnamensis]
MAPLRPRRWTGSTGLATAVAAVGVLEAAVGLTNILRTRYGSTEKGDEMLDHLDMYYMTTQSDPIPNSYSFTVQVRAVVRGLKAAQGVSHTLLPAMEALPTFRVSMNEYPEIMYWMANESAVRIDATRAAAARARSQTDEIAAGLGARVGWLNFASLNADPVGWWRNFRGDSARNEFHASVRTEHYVL